MPWGQRYLTRGFYFLSPCANLTSSVRISPIFESKSTCYFFLQPVESTRSLGPSIRPHSEARRESSPSHGLALTASKQPQQRPLRETRGTFSRLLSSAKDTKHVQNTMNSDKKIARSGSVKPKLCPRREFGPAQDYYPTRQYSLKIHHGRATGNTRNSFEFKKSATEANKQDLLKKIRASNSRVNCQKNCPKCPKFSYFVSLCCIYLFLDQLRFVCYNFLCESFSSFICSIMTVKIMK